MKELCDDAISMGASILVGGTPNSDSKGLGRFFEPTVIANSNNGMRAIQE